MRIQKATDYGFRKVVRVVVNDDEPEWIHPRDRDAAHTADTARGADGELDATLAAGTECHACVLNWDIREIVFEGSDLELEDQELQEKALDMAAAKVEEVRLGPRDMGA